MHGTVADSARGLDSLPRAALCSGDGFAMDSLPFLPAEVRLHAAGLYWLFFAAPGFLGLLALRTGNIAVICWGGDAAGGKSRPDTQPLVRLLRRRFSVLSIKITFLPMNGGYEAMTILVFFFLTYAVLAKAQPILVKRVVEKREPHT